MGLIVEVDRLRSLLKVRDREIVALRKQLAERSAKPAQ
jgi:hypothetical protein